MNIYTCWHRGNLGYGCRLRGNEWMFVPESGQIDDRIYKGLPLDELIFKNPSDKNHELQLEGYTAASVLIEVLQTLLYPASQSRSVAGRLLTRF